MFVDTLVMYGKIGDWPMMKPDINILDTNALNVFFIMIQSLNLLNAKMKTPFSKCFKKLSDYRHKSIH